MLCWAIIEVFTEANVLFNSKICIKCLPCLGVVMAVRSVGSMARNYRF